MHPIFNDRRYLIPFRATLLPQIFTDVLVIGSGVAGQRAAIAASQHGDVILTAKGSSLTDSNTYYAQGGIAAVFSKQDTIQSHVQDTLVAGADLCDQPVVQHIIEDSAARIKELIEWHMQFDLVSDQPNSEIAFGREGGHSIARILHAAGDATGKELARSLNEQTRQIENVRLFENCFVLDLITLEGSTPRCLGAITHHVKYGLQVIWAKATILACGGAGQVYRETTNPSVATGDGLAMAYRAGAKLSDMAFMQFHPTTLYVAGAARSLISEAVRGEGAHLIDHQGKRFMLDCHKMAELAPRDIVSRAILSHMSKTNKTHVYLDCRHIGKERFATRFPGISNLLKKFDLDPSTDPIPIHPSAHYMVGGVHVDDQTRTSLQGLYACGEVACTGFHGANRLASNSLLEGLVCGQIAGNATREMIDEPNQGPYKIISDIPLSARSELDLNDVKSSLRSVMWRHVGIERDGDRLDEVAEMCQFWARYTLDKIFDDHHGWELQNMLLVGTLITQASQWRQESRGTHFRTDHPKPLGSFHVHDLWQRGKNGAETRPVQTEIPVAQKPS